MPPPLLPRAWATFVIMMLWWATLIAAAAAPAAPQAVGGGGETATWMARFRRSFARLRDRLLRPSAPGAEPWTDADLEAAP
eukprot:gene11444-12201_t